MIVCHDRHNRQEINNSIQEENHHIQTNEEDHNIDLKKNIQIPTNIDLLFLPWISPKERERELGIVNDDYLPQIFSGASSSSRIGWLRKISRDFKHNPRTSFSLKWTFLFGLAPRTKQNKEWMICLSNALFVYYIRAIVGWSYQYSICLVHSPFKQ